MRKGRKGGCALSVALLVAVQSWSLAESERRGKVAILTQFSLSCPNPHFFFFFRLSEYSQGQGKVHVVSTPRLLILGVPYSEYGASVL
jgi:hypothetical protein